MKFQYLKFQTSCLKTIAPFTPVLPELEPNASDSKSFSEAGNAVLCSVGSVWVIVERYRVSHRKQRPQPTQDITPRKKEGMTLLLMAGF